MTTPKLCPTCKGSGRATCGEGKNLARGYGALCDRPAGHELPHESRSGDAVIRWPERPLVDDCGCEDKTPGHACGWQRIGDRVYVRASEQRSSDASDGCSGGVGNTPPPTCATCRNASDMLHTEFERLQVASNATGRLAAVRAYRDGWATGALWGVQWAWQVLTGRGLACAPSDVIARDAAGLPHETTER